MESSRIRKIARVLNALMLVALVCNLIILYLVPVAVVSLELSDGYGLLGAWPPTWETFSAPARTAP